MEEWHQSCCENNFLDDINKLLNEVSESNTIVTGASENNTNKISKVPSEGHECAINEAYEHMVFWKKNNFRRLPNSAGKLFVDELTKLIDC